MLSVRQNRVKRVVCSSSGMTVFRGNGGFALVDVIATFIDSSGIKPFSFTSRVLANRSEREFILHLLDALPDKHLDNVKLLSVTPWPHRKERLSYITRANGQFWFVKKWSNKSVRDKYGPTDINVEKWNKWRLEVVEERRKQADIFCFSNAQKRFSTLFAGHTVRETMQTPEFSNETTAFDTFQCKIEVYRAGFERTKKDLIGRGSSTGVCETPEQARQSAYADFLRKHYCEK